MRLDRGSESEYGGEDAVWSHKRDECAGRNCSHLRHRGRTDSEVDARELADIVRTFKAGLAASTASSQHGVLSSFALPSTSSEKTAECVQDRSSRSAHLPPPRHPRPTAHPDHHVARILHHVRQSRARFLLPPSCRTRPPKLQTSAWRRRARAHIGTISPASREGMYVAGTSANRNLKPVVLDPVGGGATTFRKEVVRGILNHTQVTLLKGNAAELASIAGKSDEVKSRGVDSGAGQLKDPIGLVKDLARKERCLVLLSGKKDYLTDGLTVITSDNGHPLLGAITGSGCALGVTVGAGLAAACNLAKNSRRWCGFVGNTLVRHCKWIC